MSEILNRISLRNASPEDLPQIIKLIAYIVISKNPLKYADEVISNPPLTDYIEAFKEILSVPNEAIVGVVGDEIVGYLQISYIPGLTHRGKKRAIVEDVRISRNYRGINLGRMLMSHAIERAKQKGCWVISLTTNKWRAMQLHFMKSWDFSEAMRDFEFNFEIYTLIK